MADNKSENSEENGDNSVELMTIYDLIDELGAKALKDDWSFYPITDIYGKENVLDSTAISYRIVDRKHFEQSARKPAYKMRQQRTDSEQGYTEFGERFDTEIEFAFWGREYRKVSNRREWFEKFIHQRKSELKKAGIIRFLFDEQGEDSVVEINNNYYIKQSVFYQVIHPRISKIPFKEIKSIQSRLRDCIDGSGFDDKKNSDDFMNGRVL